MPHAARPRLLFWGIALALGMRGVAILVGVELIERFHVVIYGLGVLLLTWPGGSCAGWARRSTPARARGAAGAARGAGHRGLRGRALLHPRPRPPGGPPLLLALAAIVAADIAFAVDSIPAAFAITTDSFAIWAANAFALLGWLASRSSPSSSRRFRYLDETIAVVLATVAVKLLVEDAVHIGPGVSLAIVVVCSPWGSRPPCWRPARPQGAAAAPGRPRRPAADLVGVARRPRVRRR